jgi:uncharacterized membrane protein
VRVSSPTTLARAETRTRLAHLHGAFGTDRFGVVAERFARWFGTPQFILGQTAAVTAWIALNVAVVALRWDPYPFILLNLAFSTQAAYAAPLILLAQTRQAERDKVATLAFEAHRDAIEGKHIASEARIREVLDQQAEIARRLEVLTALVRDPPPQPKDGRRG